MFRIRQPDVVPGKWFFGDVSMEGHGGKAKKAGSLVECEEEEAGQLSRAADGVRERQAGVAGAGVEGARSRRKGLLERPWGKRTRKSSEVTCGGRRGQGGRTEGGVVDDH